VENEKIKREGGVQGKARTRKKYNSIRFDIGGATMPVATISLF